MLCQAVFIAGLEEEQPAGQPVCFDCVLLTNWCEDAPCFAVCKLFAQRLLLNVSPHLRRVFLHFDALVGHQHECAPASNPCFAMPAASLLFALYCCKAVWALLGNDQQSCRKSQCHQGTLSGPPGAYSATVLPDAVTTLLLASDLLLSTGSVGADQGVCVSELLLLIGAQRLALEASEGAKEQLRAHRAGPSYRTCRQLDTLAAADGSWIHVRSLLSPEKAVSFPILPVFRSRSFSMVGMFENASQNSFSSPSSVSL